MTHTDLPQGKLQDVSRVSFDQSMHMDLRYKPVLSLPIEASLFFVNWPAVILRKGAY